MYQANPSTYNPKRLPPSQYRIDHLVGNPCKRCAVGTYVVKQLKTNKMIGCTSFPDCTSIGEENYLNPLLVGTPDFYEVRRASLQQ